MAWINIVATDNGRGLSCDIQLIKKALAALGHRVDVSHCRHNRYSEKILGWRRRINRAWLALYCGHALRYDLNIMLEHASPAHFRLAKKNVLIPNPEWLLDRDRRLIDRFDGIFTKTADATQSMRKLAEGKVHKIGFTSKDHFLPHHKCQRRFLHLAGASPMKGTERLLNVWRRHPEWPELLVVQSASRIKNNGADPPNINRRVGFVLSETQISRLQNSYRYHVCLSETEGWGHYIVEGMSCGAVILTCDGPPMNELITAQRGLLVKAREGEALHLSKRYLFDEIDLERKVEDAIAMSEMEIEVLGLNAREWFLNNDGGFQGRLESALKKILQD